MNVTAPRESPGYFTGHPDLLGRRDIYGFGTRELSVRTAVPEYANTFIRQHHYSGTVVWSSTDHFEVWWYSERIGVLQFGPAMNPASGNRIVSGATANEWLELNRMALTDAKPKNAASRAIRYGLTLLRAKHPGLRWVQSFADERCGKLGAVYQACSFLYCGSHLSTFYELDGEWFHKSAWGRPEYDKRGWWCGPKIARFNANRERAVPRTFRQFRYIKFLRAADRTRLLLPVLPYPKISVPNEATA